MRLLAVIRQAEKLLELIDADFSLRPEHLPTVVQSLERGDTLFEGVTPSKRALTAVPQGYTAKVRCYNQVGPVMTRLRVVWKMSCCSV